nr:carboxypeptidase-like regulatory domain-containing protein [Pyrinomonadaceae bacterium]
TINSRFDSFNGTFNNNGGMFSFNASLINAPGRTFNNLTVNSGFNSISSPTPPIVAGTLSLVDGTLNSYTIRADGNISYASTFDGGSAQIEFSDVATRTVNLPANANMLAMLINNPNVTVKTDDAAASTFIGFSTEVRSGNFVQGNAPLNFGPGAVGGGNAYNLNITGGTFTGSSAALNFNNGGGLYITNGNFQGGTGPLVGAFGITINQSGGTFSTQGNVDITSFVLSGGTFNAPSGIMTVISDWTHISGGAFNAGTGTVKFTGYSVFNCANLMVINVNATETFNNLQFANQGCNTRFISSGDTLIVNGNLTLANNQLGGGRIRPLGAINIDPTFTSAGSTIVEFITPNTNFVISNPASTVAMLPIEMNAANSTLTSSGAGKINFSGATLLNGTLNQPNAIWDFTSYPGFTQSGGIFNGSAAQLNIANGINGNILTGGTFNGGTGLINGGWGQTGGTFSTQGDMNAAQFNLAGGIFNAPSGILDISAGFTHTAGGTFNPGSGTVQTSVLPGVYGMAFDVNTTENFNNLKFNGTYNNANHFIAAGDTLIVNGDLTFSGRGVSGGSIVANGNVFYQNFGAYRNATTVVRFEDTASRTITLCGDVSTCNGTYTSDTQPMLVNNPNIIINTGLTANGAMTIPALTLQQGIFNQNDGRVTMTNYNQSGGIYNGGTFSQSFGTLNSFTNFTLTGGDFNAAPSMTLDGNFTHTTASGNFNEGTGIVYFYSTFFGSNGTIDVNGNETFYNVAFYSGNGTNIAAGDTLTVNGTATLRTGTLNGGTINAKGNVDVLRAAVGGSFQGGTTNVVFSGSTDQTFSNQDGFASFGGTWTVNKPNSVTSAENNFAPAAPTNLLISGNIGRSFAGIYVPLNLVSGNAVQTGAYSHGFSSLTVSPAASFVNEFGGTITLSGDVNNDGIIRLNANGAGCQADSILIRSNNATQRNWNGAGYFFMTDVDVSGQAGTPLITVYNGTNSGNNGANWIFNSNCFIPTAANVSVGGKVLNAEGNGIANVRIILTDAQGNSRVAVSNSFGNYRFDEVAAGQTVTLSANSKKFNFTNPTQILNVLENVSEMNFIAEGR